MTATRKIFDPAWLMRATQGQWLRMPTNPISRVCHDTRTLCPGDLYVAIRGKRLDGHSLLEEAFRKGAAAAMVDEEYLAKHPQSADPLLVVRETLSALGQLASMHRHRVGAWITGLTGSIGKTTVKDMLATLLSQHAATVCTQGNWNNVIGLPLSMLQMSEETQFGVFELGMNHPGEILPLSEMLSPDWGVITTIGPVHVEFFHSVEEIANEKADLLRALPRSGTAFLHADDPYFPILKAAAPCPVKTMGVSSKGNPDLRLEMQNGQLSVHEASTGAVEHMPVPVAGAHNLVNAGLAMLVARTAGCSWEQIRRGFAQYRPAPMRWEVQSSGSYTIVNDAYNASPPSMEAALDTFREMRAQGRKWLVLGDMLELGDYAVQAHTALGTRTATGPWVGMAVVGLHAQTVRAAAVAAGMEEDSVAAFHTVKEAGAWLRERLVRGDTLLLKGSRGVKLEDVLQFL